MILLKPIIYIVLILLLQHEKVLAQKKSGKVSCTYTTRQFTLKDGLPAIQITSLMQDSKGFLWIGTKSGICRWDGKRINSFATSPDTRRQVSSIVESPGGKIFISFPFFPAFQIIDKNKSEIVMLPDPYKNLRVESFHFENDKILLKLNPSNLVKDEQKAQILLYNKDGLQIKPVLTTIPSTLCYKNRDTLISITSGVVVDGNSYIKIFLEYNGGVKDSLLWRFKDFLDLGFRNNGNHQISGLLYEKENKILYSYPKIHNGKLVLKTKTIVDDWKTRNQRLLNVLNNSNLIISGNELFRIKNSQASETVLQDLPGLAVAYQDREGNLWLGCEQGLLCYFRFGIKEYKYHFKENQFDDIWSLSKKRNGEFLLSSYSKGYYQTDKSHLNWTSLNDNIFQNSGLTDRNLMFGAFGTISGSDDVSILPCNYGFIIRKDWQYKYNKLLHGAEIYGSASDTTNHKIYVLHYLSLQELNTKTLEVKYLLTNKDAGMKNFTHITLDAEMNPVVTGPDKIIKRVGKQWIALSDSISAFSVCTDYKNTLWCVNKRDQLFYLSDKRPITIKGLPFIDFPLALCTWSKYWLVIGGGKELIFFNLKKYYEEKKVVYRRIDYNTGLVMLEGGQNNFLVNDTDSSIYWCCSDKVLQIFPRRLLQAVPVQPVTILGVSAIDNQDIPDTMEKKKNGELHFSMDYRNLFFEMSSPTFNDNDLLEYHYLLKGYDEIWHSTKDQRIVYKNLDPGSYQLLVKVSADSALFSGTTYSDVLHIPGHIWESRLFYVAILIIVVLLTTSIAYLISKRQRLKRFKKTLEEKELTELQLRALRSKFTTHFSGNVYNAIVHLLEKKQYDDAINYLLKFTRLNNDLIRNAEKKSRSLKEEIKLLQDYLSIEKLRYRDKLNFTINIAEDVSQSIEVPMMLLHTFADNAIKHGLMSKRGYGSLRVSIFNKNEGTLAIEIEDDGIGREEAKKYNKESTKEGLSTLERQIQLFNQHNSEKIKIDVFDIFGNDFARGTLVTIFIPHPFNYE